MKGSIRFVLAPVLAALTLVATSTDATAQTEDSQPSLGSTLKMVDAQAIAQEAFTCAYVGLILDGSWKLPPVEMAK
jgi:hypothetical protein